MLITRGLIDQEAELAISSSRLSLVTSTFSAHVCIRRRPFPEIALQPRVVLSSASERSRQTEYAVKIEQAHGVYIAS